MSLNWDVRDCPDPKFLQSDEQWHVTEALIFKLMDIGIGRVTIKNYKEVWIRLRMCDMASYPMLQSRRENGTIEIRSLTLDEVKQYVGLKTNVTEESSTKFARKLTAWLRKDVEDLLRAETANR